MMLKSSSNEPNVTAELIAEAAAWLAVLHGPNRTAATERGFSQWVKRSADHARAFEEVTEIWEESRNIRRPRVLHTRSRLAPEPRFRFVRTAAVAAVLALVAVVLTFYFQQRYGVSTNIGEQRVLALDDGSRVVLNTATRVVVAYSEEARRVELKDGEALFEVAHEPSRPFIVTAGTRSIKALGTSFVVRRDARQMAVILVEGKVSVSSSVPESALPEVSGRSDRGASQSHDPEKRAGMVTLSPGERVVFNEAQPVKKDRPRLDKLLAWQRREVALDNTALSDAVNEMNRYNRKPIEIGMAETADVRVTGLFRAGDSLSFARAVAEVHHFDVIEESDRILLR